MGFHMGISRGLGRQMGTINRGVKYQMGQGAMWACGCPAGFLICPEGFYSGSGCQMGRTYYGIKVPRGQACMFQLSLLADTSRGIPWDTLGCTMGSKGITASWCASHGTSH